MENKSSVNERPFCSKRQVIKFGYRRLRSFYQGTWLNSLLYADFVNGGFSATVGIAMGSGSLRRLRAFSGGYLADSPTYGRKLTLLFSAGLSILAAVVLALTQTLPMLILVNLIVD